MTDQPATPPIAETTPTPGPDATPDIRAQMDAPPAVPQTYTTEPGGNTPIATILEQPDPGDPDRDAGQYVDPTAVQQMTTGEAGPTGNAAP